MSDAPATLMARLDELESRVAFQEAAMNELSDALAQARHENARTLLALERVLGDLRELRTLQLGDPSAEPPPPHY